MTNYGDANTPVDAVARAALAALPARLRTPYVMRRMANASEADISDALGTPRPLVARRVRRAQRRLLAAFDDAGIAAPDADIALHEFLVVPPASHFVPRVMAAISRLPDPRPVAPSLTERATRLLVTVALSGALFHAARVVFLALRARWRS